ncbi:uncharacterized protein LOC119318304 [Triticum dicoccoides]|uniref:uncharacterized protein LOC119318304 n=1 Tax=Triticum dicoccoides TaxID=85692 RepID=UPI0018917628|nr:uncharacterized protein LOC119318304 [Triticum dicoccoides]
MASTGPPPPPCSRGDPRRRPAVQRTPTAAMPATRSPPPPCPTGVLYRRASLQAIPTAAMPARRPPSTPCPTGDPYRRALLRASPTTALLSRSSPPPPREIPAAALPSGKTRFSPEKWEGYYFLEDAEGYLFQEADGGFYFLECFEGEGYYYQSEESDYFHTGQSLYDKDYGLQTLDSELQALSLHSDLGKRGQLLEERCKGSKARDDDCRDGGSPCLKVLEASGVSGHRHIARREPKKGV